MPQVQRPFRLRFATVAAVPAILLLTACGHMHGEHRRGTPIMAAILDEGGKPSVIDGKTRSVVPPAGPAKLVPCGPDQGPGCVKIEAGQEKSTLRDEGPGEALRVPVHYQQTAGGNCVWVYWYQGTLWKYPPNCTP